MTILPGYSETMNEVGKAIWKAERDVMDGHLRNENFELRVHPDRLAAIRATVDSLTSGLINMEAGAKLLGINVVEDSDVEPGHPVLRCTWEMTL